MKIKGRLLDRVSSRVEAAYAGKDNVIQLTDVPCELTFKTGQAYVEHEDEKHNYLPCFKLRGIIDEVRGDFPYNISCVYFGSDDQSSLTKTISYYPSPKELAHMITVGGFYSKRFEIPDVIRENTYSFPALVDLTIVPPPNPAAYEAATYDPMADELDVNSVNLPVVYVKIKGSGVTRKTDPLLDYYGIDLDNDFQAFAMTAESSGYRQPQLLEYIPEPEPEPEPEQAVTDMPQQVDEAHYITPEEEAELLADRSTQYAPQQEEIVHEFVAGDPEDALLTRLSQDIDRRVRDRHVSEEVNYEQVFGPKKSQHSNDLLSMRRRELESRNEKTNQPKPEKQPDKQPAKANERTVGEKSLSTSDARSMPRSEIAKPVPEKPAVKRPTNVSQLMTAAAARAAERARSARLTNPETPQKVAENKMDFNPEANAFVADKREQDAPVKGEEKDVHTLQDMHGADVADAREQSKIDDQRALELAQEAARAAQESVNAAKQAANSRPEGKPAAGFTGSAAMRAAIAERVGRHAARQAAPVDRTGLLPDMPEQADVPSDDNEYI